jgi:SPP1 gp7 family putative phage head morphogenesis protein
VKLRTRKARQLAANAKRRGRRPPNPLAVDPTRTSGIRRRFVTELRRRFARVKLDVVRLLTEEDALGLLPQPGPGVPTGNASYFSSCERDERGRCLPGDGGGDDDEGDDDGEDVGDTLSEMGFSRSDIRDVERVGRGTETIARLSREPKAVEARDISSIEGVDESVEIRTEAEPIDGPDDVAAVIVGPDGSLIDGNHRIAGLRKGGNSRVNVIVATEEDLQAAEEFGGLQGRGSTSEENWIRWMHARAGLTVNRRFTANQRWRFRSDPDKVREFKAWLNQQLRSRVVGQSEEALWRAYVEEGFRKGAGRAFDDTSRVRRATRVREELTSADPAAFRAGRREEFLRSAFGRPVAVEKVKLLAGRSFDDLEDITSTMSNRMVRALADGLVRGQGPREIARTLAAEVDIGRGRAETIARTEIIRSHAEGQLEALEQLGVESVGVAVEWSIADENACPRCQAMQGVVLKLAEARGMIPLHPS